jgi:hypothetical protein
MVLMRIHTNLSHEVLEVTSVRHFSVPRMVNSLQQVCELHRNGGQSMRILTFMAGRGWELLRVRAELAAMVSRGGSRGD